MARFYAVTGFYYNRFVYPSQGDFFRLDEIRPSRREARQDLYRLVRDVDREIYLRHVYGPPEGIFIDSQDGADSGYFAPYL